MMMTVTESASATHATRKATLGPASLRSSMIGKAIAAELPVTITAINAGWPPPSAWSRSRPIGTAVTATTASASTPRANPWRIAGDAMSTCVPAPNMSIAKPMALRTGSGWLAESTTPNPVRPRTKPR